MDNEELDQLVDLYLNDEVIYNMEDCELENYTFTVVGENVVIHYSYEDLDEEGEPLVDSDTVTVSMDTLKALKG